jgi:hypothetical protein
MNSAFETFSDIDWMYECNPVTPPGPIPLEAFEPVVTYDSLYALSKESESLRLVFKMSLTKQYASTILVDPDQPKQTYLRVAFELPQEATTLVVQPLLFEMLTY